MIGFFSDSEVKQFPLVQAYGTEAFEYKDPKALNSKANNFIWKVYGTVNHDLNKEQEKPHENASKTWDHLSFAFYFPEPDKTLVIQGHLCTKL